MEIRRTSVQGATVVTLSGPISDVDSARAGLQRALDELLSSRSPKVILDLGDIESSGETDPATLSAVVYLIVKGPIEDFRRRDGLLFLSYPDLKFDFSGVGELFIPRGIRKHYETPEIAARAFEFRHNKLHDALLLVPFIPLGVVLGLLMLPSSVFDWIKNSFRRRGR